MRNKREKLLLSVALLAVAILIGDRLVLGPLVNSWKIRNDKIEKLERLRNLVAESLFFTAWWP